MSTMPPLVGTDWLADALDAPDLHVLDASYYLPAEQQNARARFADAHIPGARFFDIDDVADPEERSLPHMVPSPARFGRLVGAMGIGNRCRVVVYDQKGLFSAARAWWLFGLFGHDQVAVLDGGLPKWLREGRAVERGEPAPVAPALFVAHLRAARLRGIGDMMANVASGAEHVLDARPAGRFDGTAPEPRAGLRSGHIPGAANVPASELLLPDQTMLPPEALRARFAQAGADGSRPVVTSCGSGVTAAILSLGLRVAGLPQGALYDGSWTEWASHPETPKAP